MSPNDNERQSTAGTILVVDDEEGVRTFVADALKRPGHIVTTAENGEKALSELKQRAFDLVITDLKMPTMDGMTLLRHIKAEQPEVEVIVMTAHGSVETAVEAMKAGAFEYLQKPLSGPAELRLLVERALERKALLALKDQRQPNEGEVPLTYGAPSMTGFVRALEKVAPTAATVLVLGPSGAGKEVCSRRLHALSPRRDAPFVAINCAALSDTLLESTLFGHEKGAFTGANKRQRGQLELAQGGTFFLDEVGELKLEIQAKLLRVLEEKTFQRIGGHQLFSADVRFVAATNQALETMVAAGTFREDLYHRLAVFPLRIPSLDERREDIAGIARHLLRDIAPQLGRPLVHFADDVLAHFSSQHWPGNIRQLRNTIERAVILSEGDTITLADIWNGTGTVTTTPPPPGPAGSGTPGAALSSDPSAVGPGGDGQPAEVPMTLVEIEREAVLRAMQRHADNRAAAAAELGISVRSLYDRLKRIEAAST